MRGQARVGENWKELRRGAKIARTQQQQGGYKYAEDGAQMIAKTLWVVARERRRRRGSNRISMAIVIVLDECIGAQKRVFWQ